MEDKTAEKPAAAVASEPKTIPAEEKKPAEDGKHESAEPPKSESDEKFDPKGLKEDEVKSMFERYIPKRQIIVWNETPRTRRAGKSCAP